MSSKDTKLGIYVCLLLLGTTLSFPAVAGSIVVGLVEKSTNATVAGQPLLPGSTLFSGTTVTVDNGSAVIAIAGGTGRVVLGRGTVATLLREADRLTIMLRQGIVSLDQPDNKVPMRVEAADVVIMPAQGFKTLGAVAMGNDAVMVTAKEGLLRVEGIEPAVDVSAGNTITILPKQARSLQTQGTTASTDAPSPPVQAPNQASSRSTTAGATPKPARKGHPKLMKAFTYGSIGASIYSVIKQLASR